LNSSSVIFFRVCLFLLYLYIYFVRYVSLIVSWYNTMISLFRSRLSATSKCSFCRSNRIESCFSFFWWIRSPLLGFWGSIKLLFCHIISHIGNILIRDANKSERIPVIFFSAFLVFSVYFSCFSITMFAMILYI